MPDHVFPPDQGYPWGSAITPRSPMGWWRYLYDLMQATQGTKWYPALWGQYNRVGCKGDRFCPFELLIMCDPLLAGERFYYWGTPSIWSRYGDMVAALHGAGYISYPFYWKTVFTVIPDPADPGNLVAWQTDVNLTNLTQNLQTGAVYTYGTAPVWDSLSPWHSIAVSNNFDPRDPDLGPPWRTGGGHRI